MAEQLALTFPSDTFFVGVGAQAPYWPWIHLPRIGSQNIISHILRRSSFSPLSLCCAFSRDMVSILQPQVVAISPGPKHQHGRALPGG